MGGTFFRLMLAAALVTPSALAAQMTIQPTPPPTVTADNEPWFQAREPIMFAGNIYYPAGAQVHFNRNEMTRSGYYGDVPLYTRVTLEPYSIVFVPVSGGLMQPYERRRTGEIAGTVGTTMPSFPVVSPAEAAASGELPVIPQAPGPPTSLRPAAGTVVRAIESVPDTAIGTTGGGRPDSMSGRPLVSAAKPEGLNGIFVEYAGRRWFSSGPAVALDPSRFVRVGSHQGFAVYTETHRTDTIYIPVAASVPTLVAPYTTRPRPNG